MKAFLMVVLLAAEIFAQSSQPWSVISSGASVPANVARVGYCFFRTSDSTLHISTGFTWAQVQGGGGSGFISLIPEFRFAELPAGFWVNDCGDFTGATFAQAEDATNDFSEDYLNFVDGIESYACATFAMPGDWDRSTHPTFFIVASSPTGHASNTINFELSARYIRTNTDSWIGAQGTAETTTIQPTTANIDYITDEISPTPGGTPSSADSVQTLIQVRFFRDGDDATNDTHTADARVKLVMMEYHTIADTLMTGDGGPGGWQHVVTDVELVEPTDEVMIGSNFALEDAKFSITGDTDQKQFVLQGNSTQTENLVEFQTSTPTNLMTFSNAGVMTLISTGNISMPGAGTSSQHFGESSASAGNQSTAVGNTASSGGLQSIAFGNLASSSAAQSAAIGYNTLSSGTDAVAIGSSVSATGNFNIAIGRGLTIGGSQNIYITATNGSGTSGANNIVIGHNASAGDQSNVVAIGNASSSNNGNGISIGASASTSNGGNGIAIGTSAVANGNGPITIGQGATSGTGSSGGVFIGQSASGGGFNAICLGRGVTGFASNVFMAGSSTLAMNTFLVGNGNTNAAPAALTYRMTDGVGTNIAGTNWTFIASRGTGSGAAGDFIWQGSVPIGSGTTLQTAVNRMKLEDNALLTLGVSGQGANSILRLTATDGDQWDATTNTSDQGLFANASGGYSFDMNLGIGTTVFGASATNELAVGNGTAPSSQPIDMFQVYANDFAAGDSRAFVLSEAGDEIAIGNEQIVFDAKETNKGTIKFNSLTASQDWSFTNRTGEVRLGLDAYKTADETVTDSTTPQDDDHLTIALLASSIYRFEIEGFYTTASANAGIKVELSGTVGVTSLKAQVKLWDDANDNLDASARVTALDSPVGSDETGDNHFTISGTIETSTAGTLLLQWSQNTADAVNGTVVQRNSSFILTRL